METAENMRYVFTWTVEAIIRGTVMPRNTKTESENRLQKCRECGKRMTEPYVGDGICYHCLVGS